MDPTRAAEADAYIDQLPKVELHLHLEGSLRPATMARLASRNRLDLGTADDLADRYDFENFDGFLQLFLQGLEVLRTGEDFADATDALAEELAAQQVRYAEITTTPFNHDRRGIVIDDYVEGLDEGRRRASERGVALSWICDIPRELEPPDSHFTVDLITGPRAPGGVVGLGLGGPEPGFPAQLFASSFSKASAAGLASLPHAGETGGPESIWGAIRSLGADRIGHGTRATEDAALLEYLAENDIDLEVCLSSNQATGVIASIEEHPLRRMMDAGVSISLNTDDPAYFATTLNHELRLARDLHQVRNESLKQVQKDALAASYAPAADKTRIREELVNYHGPTQ